MQKLVSTILLIVLFISCGETKEKKTNQNTSQDKTEESTEDLSSADYNSLLINYECDMTVTEVAGVLNLSETAVVLADYQSPGKCSFAIEGFGKNPLGDDTVVIWFLEELGKAQVSKEIKSYLDEQANNEEVLSMDIELSETGDSYIVKRPANGQVVIMNGNYDHWLVLSYSPKHSYKSRTTEQHAELGAKMVDLANYLLKKHKK
ncbi:hypothetical protein [Eudoraea sp.]